jgi:hypothetical protein
VLDNKKEETDMSEKVKKTTETEEQEVKATPEKKANTKKPAEKKAEKEPNWFVRTGRKVKTGMSNHPFWTAFGGAAVGSAATVGIGFGGKKLIESRKAKKNAVYIQDDNNLDPNV